MRLAIPATPEHAEIDREKPREAATKEVRLGGIEPPTCGLKGRCSLAPRRLPLTTELQAHELLDRGL